MKKRLGELVIQIIPVMIGVYLGFVLSDWAKSNEISSKKDQLAQNISLEIESNRQKLKNVIDYHKMLRDSSRHYANSDSTPERIRFFGGLRTQSLTSSAFETGIQTGIINELELDQIQTLNKTYTQQESYNDFGKVVLSGIINFDFQNKTSSIERLLNFLSITMTDIVIKEKQLLEEYEDTLEMIDK
ncbi:hypothetical protein [Halocola ammonii]